MNSEEASPEECVRSSEVVWTVKKREYASEVLKKLNVDRKTADTKTADVYFVCGSEGKRIPAHKCVLSKMSPVFDAMFYGPHANKSDKNLPETPPDVFEDFLQFCYSDEVTLGPNNMTEVMKLLHEYQMFEGLKLCGVCWANNMTIDDVCWAYHWAIHFEMDEFKKSCSRKISANSELVFKTSGFLSCDLIVLDHILQLDTMLCDEEVVLRACLEWARYTCGKDGSDANGMNDLRKYLKDSFYNIRFNSLTIKQIREVAGSGGELFAGIIRLLADPQITGHFNQNPRTSQIPWKECDALKCNTFNRLELSRRIMRNPCELNMTLRSSRLMLLGGFHWAPVDNSNDSAKVTIEITQKSSTPKIIILTADVGLKTGIEPYLDLANSPIVLRPEFEYGISFEFDLAGSSDPHYYASYIDTEIKLDKETTIFNSQPGLNIVRGFEFNLL